MILEALTDMVFVEDHAFPSAFLFSSHFRRTQVTILQDTDFSSCLCTLAQPTLTIQ